MLPSKNAMADPEHTMGDPEHGVQVLQTFDLMRNQDSCTDFTLIAQKKSFRVHKQLLAVCSEYFKCCFRSGMLETKTDSMELQNISADGLQSVLDFIYTGKMVLSKRKVNEVLEAAVFLNIKQAIKLSCGYIMSHIKVRHAEEYLHLADLYHLTDFRVTLEDYVLENFGKLVKTANFLKLPLARLEYYIKDNRLSYTEYKLYKALEKWVIHMPDKRMEHADHLLSHIRFGLMSNEDLNRLRKKSAFRENPILNEFINEGMSFKCSTLQKQIVNFKGERSQVRSNGQIIVFANTDNGMHSCVLMNDTWLPLYDALEQPRAFTNASVCVFNNFLFVCGGDANLSQPSSMCYCFKPITCTWTRLSNMREGRCNFALVGYGNHLYAFGGVGGRNRMVENIERYDILGDSWSYLCAMGRGLSDMGYCCHGDAVYLAGGVDECCINVTTFKTFLPRISMWQRRADILSLKFRPKLFPVKDSLYLIDLYKTGGVPAKLESYDISTDQWSILEDTSFLFSRYFSAANIQDWIYFVGRNEVEDGHSKRHNVATGETEDLPALPWPVDSPLCCVLGIPSKTIKSKMIEL